MISKKFRHLLLTLGKKEIEKRQVLRKYYVQCPNRALKEGGRVEDIMSKYQKLKAKLLQEIALKAANEKMPSRPSICARYDLSRATVDKAFNELISEGWLYTVKGGGTYVSREATAMAEQEMMTWGVVVPDIAEDICPELVRGIEDFAEGKGINVILCNSDNDAEKEKSYLYRLQKAGARGILVIPAIDTQVNREVYDELLKSKIQIVFCIRILPEFFGCPSVVVNDFYGGYIATKHLMNQGYKKISFVSRYIYQTSANRFLGYSAALMEVGCPIVSEHVICCVDNYSREKLSGMIEQMLNSPNPPDAFFCHNDTIAVEVSKVIKRLGKRIPEDIGIIGFDDTRISETNHPPLSTISFGSYELGRKSAQFLYDAIVKPQAGTHSLDVCLPKLIVRKSTQKIRD